ncbi:MAG: spore cortex biosynthesis protein YabQ [Bacillota bacterium]|jgi:spore cortex biosynthesis protein YabQ
MEYVTVQLSSFVTLLLTGMVLGGFFDLYRVWRSTVKVNWFITAGGDLLFWLIALLMATPLIFWSTWLELRLYVWLAIIAGVVMYFVTFSRLLLPVLLRLVRTVTWMPRQLLRLKRQFQLIWQKKALVRESEKGKR